MKTRKTAEFLKIDLYIQLAIIIASLLLLMVPGLQSYAFITFYFGLGAFQIISYFIHLERRVKSRKVPAVYTTVLIVITIAGLLSTLSSQLLFMYLFIMLLLGIIMGFSYLIITLTELKQIKNEE